MATNKTFDVAVVGAGVFGAWTAYLLKRAGAEVVLLDAYGSGNSRASSGGESRIIRMGYGPDEIYTRMAQRSLGLWQKLFNQIGHTGISSRLFQPTGVLWLARENDLYCEAMLETFQRSGVNYLRLDRGQLLRRYPQLESGAATWGILEPDSGVLMARQAVQAVVAEAQAAGVNYLQDEVSPPDWAVARSSGSAIELGAVAGRRRPRRGSRAGVGRLGSASPGTIADQDFNHKLDSVKTVSGNRLNASQFVFACGPWLPKLFPSLLSELIHVTRQEVFFFGGAFGR